MAARDSTSASAHDQMASQLREQLQGLVPDQVGTAITSTAEEASARFRHLLDYASLAIELREPLVELIRRITGRPAPDTTRLPDIRNDQRGIVRRAARHPILVISVAVVLGVIGYAYLQGSRRSRRGYLVQA